MAEQDTNVNEQAEIKNPAEENKDTSTKEQADESALVAQLRADMAKMKAAMDKATKEAGDAKKALRAKQTAEEIAAEDQKAQAEARDKELNELRKKFAVMETSKSILVRIGGDETSASQIAEYLYGAADVDGAIGEIQKIIAAKEKALRLEYGKIPAPGAGSTDGPTITREQLDKLTLKDRAEFANKHPDEYNKLMGR